MAQKKITQEELVTNDGKNGKPAWFAYKGKVYDCTQSSFWMDGQHMGMHDAGRDLTEELDMAPHGADNFEHDTIKYIGDLE